MGVMKFRLPANEANRKLPDYRRAYITGLDRTPGRLAVELRNGLLSCVRETHRKRPAVRSLADRRSRYADGRHGDPG